MTMLAVMLGTLIGPFLLLTGVERLAGRPLVSHGTAGRLGVTLVFGLTGVAHFALAEPISRMLPPWVPGRIPLVYVTGVIELAAALAVLHPRLRRLVAWGLIVMLVLFLPVNVYAALQRIPLGGHEGGSLYLLVRVPLQALLIAWIWWFAARSQSSTPAANS